MSASSKSIVFLSMILIMSMPSWDGRTDGPAEFIDKRNLSLRIETILLSFKGKIVYDGFLRFYNVFFGSGIRSELKQSYLIAKDNGVLLKTLEVPSNISNSKTAQQLAKSAVT